MSKYKFGKNSKKKLTGVLPKVQELAKRALKYSTVDFSVIDGLRSAAEQRAMYDKGASELDGTMKISDHQTGCAIDVVPYVKGMDIWDVKDPVVAATWLEIYRAFGRAAMKLGIQLELGLYYNIGGGRDYPHISVK